MMHHCPDDAAMQALGARLAEWFRPGELVCFSGDLGAGKTTLIRACLRAMGHTGRIPSPSYALMELYPFDGHRVCHLDLYRLADPEELEYLGFRDLLDPDTLVLVEWPEKAPALLDQADWRVRIDFSGTGRQVEIRSMKESLTS